jgi:mitochondrial translocator assembly and maintenance protein 41
MKTTLERLLTSRFPPMRAGFGYGSGVFRQAASKRQQQAMVDTIFVVDNAQEWHERNVSANPGDYAFIPRYLMRAKWIEYVQKEIGGRMWFNTLVPCEVEGQGKLMLKYGVVDVKDFVLDLTNWETIYVAGRLQKPVLDLRVRNEAGSIDAIDKNIRQAMVTNRENALRAALILLGSHSKAHLFSTHQLLKAIVELSYGGDVRIGIAESPTKVQDITAGSFDELSDIYVRSDLARRFLDTDGREYFGKLNFQELAMELPVPYNRARDKVELQQMMSSAIRKSSMTQTLKGVFTAGFTKSIRYAGAKVGKRLGVPL